MSELSFYAEFGDDGVLVALYRSDIFPPVTEPVYDGEEIVGERIVSRHAAIPKRTKDVSAEDYWRLVNDPLGWSWKGDGLVKGRVQHPAIKAAAAALKR